MKYHLLIITLVLFSACKTQNGKTVSTQTNTMEKSAKQTNDCPSDGVCSLKVYENSSLVFGRQGQDNLYASRKEGDKLVVEFEFNKKGPEGTADGNYREVILFELPHDVKNLERADNQLADINMTIGIMAYRSAQYYRIDQGKFKVTREGSGLRIDLDFKLNAVDHEISGIHRTASLSK